jgi:ParB family transcriptional regulator, chromosome partitioning protein
VAEKRGMGRGLSAILPETAAEATVPELRDVPIDLIRPNPDQPRSRIDNGAITGLAESVAASGIVQPLIVRPLANGTYELVAGERRWRAAQEAGLAEVPALVRDHQDAERLQVALIENMAREDLNAIDEARACATLVEDLGVTKEELARRLGRSRSSVSNLIRLLDLPDEALDLLRSGELSEGHGRAILQVRGNELRRRLAREAAAGGWSVRETENRAKLAGQPKSGKGKAGGRQTLDSEAREAFEKAEEALESALGHEVKLGLRGGQVRAEIRFDEIEDVISLSRRLARRRAA